jgi:hypothetical protein
MGRVFTMSRAFLIVEEDHIFGYLFSTVNVMNYFFFTNSGLGYILGHYFTSSSRHPARKE